MLGKLARWLRILGFDVFFDCRVDDDQLLQLARREARVLLTKDRELAAKGGYLVMGKTWEEEVEEIIKVFHLENSLKPFTRCPVCNGELKEIDRETARRLVPPLAFQRATRFSICKECGRVYWDGTHMIRMKNVLDRIIKEAQNEK